MKAWHGGLVLAPKACNYMLVLFYVFYFLLMFNVMLKWCAHGLKWNISPIQEQVFWWVWVNFSSSETGRCKRYFILLEWTVENQSPLDQAEVRLKLSHLKEQGHCRYLLMSGVWREAKAKYEKILVVAEESNPGPLALATSALTTELRQPTTSLVQQLSYTAEVSISVHCHISP